MDSSYLSTLEASFYIFPIIAAVLTVPYLLYEYHKFGGIPPIRSFLFFSFILYLTCCYILVVMPLPTIEEVSQMTGPVTDFRLFGFIDNIREYTNFVLTDPSTWAEGFQSVYVYEPFYNILMTIPFGIDLKYYFNCGWFKTIFFGFLLSLSFEMLQLSALFGLYPRPYRLFQLDDLLLNTSGAAIGWILAPLFTWMLPSREKLDQISYERGSKVSVIRRGAAFLVDGFILMAFMNLISNLPGFEAFDILNGEGFTASFFAFYIGAFLYFIVLPWITRGRTPGKMLVGLRVVTEDGRTPSFKQYLIRYGLEYLVALPAPVLAVKVFQYTEYTNGLLDIFLVIISGCFLVFFILFAFQILISLFTGEARLTSERMSRTKIISTHRAGQRAGSDSRRAPDQNPDGRMNNHREHRASSAGNNRTVTSGADGNRRPSSRSSSGRPSSNRVSANRTSSNRASSNRGSSNRIPSNRTISDRTNAGASRNSQTVDTTSVRTRTGLDTRSLNTADSYGKQTRSASGITAGQTQRTTEDGRNILKKRRSS